MVVLYRMGRRDENNKIITKYTHNHVSGRPRDPRGYSTQLVVQFSSDQ